MLVYLLQLRFTEISEISFRALIRLSTRNIRRITIPPFRSQVLFTTPAPSEREGEGERENNPGLTKDDGDFGARNAVTRGKVKHDHNAVILIKN